MRPLFETVDDLTAGADVIRARRYGVVEVAGGELQRVRLRPFPSLATLADVMWLGRWYHERATGNRCWLYYNQPRRHRSYLALKYVVSTSDCTLATFRGALAVLDDIARLKRSDALLTDAASWRISDRLLARWGWEPHCPSRWHRHYIKRFYGEYPATRTKQGQTADISHEHDLVEAC
ncbi:MAG: hypothetical protein K8T25_09125 [Planctomycetia bacterium]|nr:hypothetical protein [Planctomycetia bacterium]